MAAAETPDPVAGELVLGRYRPVKPLGSGGSGSVWLARDERSGLDVALKIVQREGKAASRAEREASAAARLRHERCVRAYALAHDERHVYIAYEYVPGETMRDAMRAGRLDDAAAIEAAAQMLDGLAHAHAHGIVHRDVKPANVQLTQGDGVSVRLLDFGLAQIQEAETLTAIGDVPGTLAYISPERLAGRDATAAADVWAVGVVLWEALAGYHPFWTSSLLETARRISDGAEPLRTARPDLPDALLAAVDRALALDPRDRPSAERLAEALRTTRRRRPARAQPKKRAAKAARPLPSVLPVARLLPAAGAGLFAGWTAARLPFFPTGWDAGLAAAAAALTLANRRAGIALALAVPILPLGNASSGLALLYAALAAGWLALSWREPESAFFFLLGPLLAPLGLIGLLPLAAQAVRGRVRRAAQAAAAVLMAGLVAGLRDVGLPFGAGPAPGGLGLTGSERPLAVGEAFVRALSERHVLVLEALVLAAAAVLLPLAAKRGLWGAALFGAGLLTAALAVAPGAPAVGLVLCSWATALVLAWRAAGPDDRAAVRRLWSGSPAVLPVDAS
jgi:serine/threonine-protein kinase